MLIRANIKDIKRLKSEGFKIIIIDDTDIQVSTSVVKMAHLMPSPSMLHSNEFEMRYLNYLDTGDTRRSMLMIMLSSIRGEKIALVNSNDYDIDYLNVMVKLIQEYGLSVGTINNYPKIKVSSEIEKYIESQIHRYKEYYDQNNIVTRGGLISCINDLNLKEQIEDTYRKPLEELTNNQLGSVCDTFMHRFNDRVDGDSIFKSPLETGGMSLGEISKQKRLDESNKSKRRLNFNLLKRKS